MELNNREIAILFWSVAFFAGMSFKQQVRRGLGGTALAFCKPGLLVPLGVAAGWILACVIALHWVGFWDWNYLKTTIVWAITFAFMALFQVDRICKNPAYLAHLTRDLVGATAVVEFIAELHTFNLVLELALVPFLALVTMLYVVAEFKPEYTVVRKLAGWVLMTAGLIYLVSGLYEVVDDFDRFATVETLEQFTMPVVLSLCYVPFIYGFAVYITYESYFSRLNWLVEDAVLRKRIRRFMMVSIRGDLDLLQRWWHEFMSTRPTNEDALRRSIQRVRFHRKWEKNPPPVNPSEGWSPYEVMDILADLGLGTGEYHLEYDGEEWRACSTMLELDNNLLPDNLAYYVEGDQYAAKRLKLVLNVNNPENASTSEERHWSAAVRLLHALLSADKANEIAAALWNTKTFDREVEGCHIRLWREGFTGPRAGYSRIFQIEHNVIH